MPRRQRLECALLKGITAHYVMTRAGVIAAQAAERELLTELAYAIERGAPQTLDPLLRPSWDAAGTDADRRRVVIDQVASPHRHVRYRLASPPLRARRVVAWVPCQLS